MMDEASDLTPILMVDRGNCTFVTKVRNIEKAGVKMAVICDNTPQNTENVIMADDGSGSTINIPSFLIRKRDCQLLKETIASNSSVYIKGQMEIVHPDNRVEYEYWYSTMLDQEAWFLYDLSLY